MLSENGTCFVLGDGDVSPVQPAHYADVNRAWDIMDINLVMNNIEVNRNDVLFL